MSRNLRNIQIYIAQDELLQQWVMHEHPLFEILWVGIHREIIMGEDSTLEILWVRTHRENIMVEHSP